MSQDEFIQELFYAYVFQWMENHGIRVITATFNGEGDSGSFDEYLELKFLEPNVHDSGRYNKIYDLLENERVQFTPAQLSANCSLKKYILHLSEQVEHNTPHGMNWWDSEGGRGSVEWILSGYGSDGNQYKKGICLTVEERIVEYSGNCFAVHGLTEEQEPT